MEVVVARARVTGFRIRRLLRTIRLLPVVRGLRDARHRRAGRSDVRASLDARAARTSGRRGTARARSRALGTRALRPESLRRRFSRAIRGRGRGLGGGRLSRRGRIRGRTREDRLDPPARLANDADDRTYRAMRERTRRARASDLAKDLSVAPKRRAHRREDLSFARWERVEDTDAFRATTNCIRIFPFLTLPEAFETSTRSSSSTAASSRAHL